MKVLVQGFVGLLRAAVCTVTGITRAGRGARSGPSAAALMANSGACRQAEKSSARLRSIVADRHSLRWLIAGDYTPGVNSPPLRGGEFCGRSEDGRDVVKTVETL